MKNRVESSESFNYSFMENNKARNISSIQIYFVFFFFLNESFFKQKLK